MLSAGEQQADTIKDAYRTGFRLQQQGVDLQRQGSDLQRRVAQDIYNKQQEILRLQVDNDRQRKQVAIEMVDLEYRRRISNEEGRVAAVLEAEAALMKTKAEGEANIEAKKRLLELDIDKQKRETENYIFELGRTIDGIRRSTLSLEMDVADYRLKIERQIGEQRRIEETGQAAGASPSGGAVRRGALSNRQRDPDAEKTGSISVSSSLDRIASIRAWRSVSRTSFLSTSISADENNLVPFSSVAFWISSCNANAVASSDFAAFCARSRSAATKGVRHSSNVVPSLNSTVFLVGVKFAALRRRSIARSAGVVAIKTLNVTFLV